jgi:uncharacterized protein (DUF3084 family)
MTLLSRTQSLALRDTDPKSLGGSRIVQGSLACSTLTEGADFSVDYTLGLVRRLRPVADQLHTFTFQHDDMADEIAASESVQATTDLLSKVLAAYQRLTQIQTQATTLQTQMTALKASANGVPSTFATNAARDSAIKQIATAIGTLADGLSGTAAAVSDEAVDLQFLARQIAADLGVKVTA